MLKFILAALLGVALAGCQKKDPQKSSEIAFLVTGKKITVRGTLNAAATVKKEQAEQAVRTSVQLLENGN